MTMPEPVRNLTWLQRLVLVDDYLRNPRRFLAMGTHSADEAKQFDCQPKATKETPVAELRAVLDYLLPDDASTTRFASNRRIQRSFLLNALQELPADELETAVVRVVSRLLPATKTSKDQTTSLHANETWANKKTRVVEHVQDVLTDIETDIHARLVEGQRHPDIIATADLPTSALFSMHSESDLFWGDLAQPRRLTVMPYEALPENSPLRRLDPTKLPRLDKTGAGKSLVILGPSVPATIQSLPRAYYTLRCVEEHTKYGWGVWSKRHRIYLDMNRETEADYRRFVAFEELVKKPWQVQFPYPAAPTAPPLAGFANRALFSLDCLAHLGSYVSRPKSQHTLNDLLTARRVLVSEGADQYPEHTRNGAAIWVGKWFTDNNRIESLESLWALAKSTFAAIEEVEVLWRDHALEEFQKQFILKDTK
jgi:hypothetical protein